MIIGAYNVKRSIKATAADLHISEGVVRKCLITHNLISPSITQEILELLDKGYSQDEIACMLKKSPSCINANLPYSRGTYLRPSKTINAERIRKCRQKKSDR